MPAKRAAKPQARGRHRSEPDPTAKKLGARIKGLREDLGFTFDAFVEESGLGRGYVSELERGLVVPTLHSLAKVAAALEITIADLVAADSSRELLFLETRGLNDGAVAELRRLAAQLKARGSGRP